MNNRMSNYCEKKSKRLAFCILVPLILFILYILRKTVFTKAHQHRMARAVIVKRDALLHTAG